MIINSSRKALCDTKTLTVEQAITTLKKRECYIVFRKPEHIIDIMDIYTDRYYGSCGAHPIFFDSDSVFKKRFSKNRCIDNDEVAVFEIKYKGE